MAKSDLKTDYVDSQYLGDKKYKMINNADGTVSFQDVTQYVVNGDKLHADEINNQNNLIKEMTSIKIDDNVQDELNLSTNIWQKIQSKKLVVMIDKSGDMVFPETVIDNVVVNANGNALSDYLKVHDDGEIHIVSEIVASENLRLTKDIYALGSIFSGGKTSGTDQQIGVAIGKNGRIYMRSSTSDTTGIYFYNGDTENPSSYIENRSSYLYSNGSFISERSLYSNGKTATNDGKAGCVLHYNGNLYLSSEDSPTIYFYPKNVTGNTGYIQCQDNYMYMNRNLVNAGALLSGGKTSASDGKAGVVCGTNGLLYIQHATQPMIYFYVGNATNNTQSLGIVSGALYTSGAFKANGTVTGNGAYINSSDARLKTNKQYISDDLMEVYDKLTPCAFEYINNDSGKLEIGLYAQDVIKAFEECGLDYHDYNIIGKSTFDEEDKTEYYTLAYEYIDMLTMNKVKMLEKENQDLRYRVEDLEDKLDEILRYMK